VKGDTILSPTWTDFTAGPASTTAPVNSCPMTKPVSDFWWPLKTWSSLPHRPSQPWLSGGYGNT